MPPQPCKGCKHAESCTVSGLVNRQAVAKWIEDMGGIECPDFDGDFYHGLEGVSAWNWN